MELISKYLLTVEGFTQAQKSLPIQLFEQIYRSDLRDDDEAAKMIASYNQIAYGNEMLRERIVIKVVEKIDVQAEIQKLM